LGNILKGTINVLIASRHSEDQKLINAALPENMDFFIVDTVKDEYGAVVKSEYLKPDIIILDLQLTVINSPNLVRIIRRKSPSTSVIVLCDKDEDNHSILAFNAGISGFLLKESDLKLLAHIVNMIFLGGIYINPSVLFKAISSVIYIRSSSEPANQMFYSETERNIVKHLAQGFTDAQIARELNFSTGTIRNYLMKIRNKTNMKSRVNIVTYSIASGLINI